MIAIAWALMQKLAGGALALLARVPWWAWLALAVLGGSYVYGEGRYSEGVAKTRAEYETRLKLEADQHAQFIAEELSHQGAVTEKVVTVYVDKVRTVYKTGATLIKEVPVYVPMDAPDLPGGFRVLHDAAAAGIMPDRAGIADAAPVPAQVVAETNADNYTTCHANAALLIGMQDWAVGQGLAPPY
jgi:hypothetical protein